MIIRNIIAIFILKVCRFVETMISLTMYKVNFGSTVLERYVLFKQKNRKNCNSCCNYDDMVTMMISWPWWYGDHDDMVTMMTWRPWWPWQLWWPWRPWFHLDQDHHHHHHHHHHQLLIAGGKNSGPAPTLSSAGIDLRCHHPTPPASTAITCTATSYWCCFHHSGVHTSCYQ